MKNIITPATDDSHDGRYLTGVARQLYCARQLYFKFDEWSGSPKEWFPDAVAYQLRTLTTIINTGNADESLDATHLHTLYSKFSPSKNLAL